MERRMIDISKYEVGMGCNTIRFFIIGQFSTQVVQVIQLNVHYITLQLYLLDNLSRELANSTKCMIGPIKITTY